MNLIGFMGMIGLRLFGGSAVAEANAQRRQMASLQRDVNQLLRRDRDGAPAQIPGGPPAGQGGVTWTCEATLNGNLSRGGTASATITENGSGTITVHAGAKLATGDTVASGSSVTCLWKGNKWYLAIADCDEIS